ncbi:ADP-ribosylglycohydrolase family protein [Streptomyces indicus]|uniref:ADP-ribosylglycohydrolase n=1 Tax=Streptomyces indicus TaxID=417292 RepID=A0A1G8UI54_9ACTN|nr:ADP-ribosylglycohydrolase family protein [Streptomyces indicus]SDJ52640.1 ADP-ribosylglycohydrolase [Streptomyces indicus]
MTPSLTPAPNRSAARRSLEGLALGDAFGERWFPLFRTPSEAYEQIQARQMPAEPEWHFTDDTVMALGIQRVLDEYGEIRQGPLALSFALLYDMDRGRGYGYGMHQLLPRLLQESGRWEDLAAELFDGQGSLGNGAAMRVAPLGAWFSHDLQRAADQAVLSAEVTHRHRIGVAGAVAVAVASALSARGELDLREVADRTPDGPVREGLHRAAEVPSDTAPWRASDLLGNGQRVRADDTVPFALWSAARHPDDLVSALWSTAEGLGDVDTTCAITGGVVGARTGLDGVPEEWLRRREPVPGGRPSAPDDILGR